MLPTGLHSCRSFLPCFEQMLYAELLWVDRLGMYVRTELEGQDPSIVRVPFYRPVLDERDARCVT